MLLLPPPRVLVVFFCRDERCGVFEKNKCSEVHEIRLVWGPRWWNEVAESRLKASKNNQPLKDFKALSCDLKIKTWFFFLFKKKSSTAYQGAPRRTRGAFCFINTESWKSSLWNWWFAAQKSRKYLSCFTCSLWHGKILVLEKLWNGVAQLCCRMLSSTVLSVCFPPPHILNGDHRRGKKTLRLCQTSNNLCC